MNSNGRRLGHTVVSATPYRPNRPRGSRVSSRRLIGHAEVVLAVLAVGRGGGGRGGGGQQDEGVDETVAASVLAAVAETVAETPLCNTYLPSNSPGVSAVVRGW
jgi:hypothetical protein